jgi:hypothetical protein
MRISCQKSPREFSMALPWPLRPIHKSRLAGLHFARAVEIMQLHDCKLIAHGATIGRQE